MGIMCSCGEKGTQNNATMETMNEREKILCKKKILNLFIIKNNKNSKIF